MAVYDDENEDKKPLAPEELDAREGDDTSGAPEAEGETGAGAEEKQKLRSRTPWAKSQQADAEERAATLGRVSKITEGAGEGGNGSGFYRPGKDDFKGDKKAKGSQLANSVFKNKKLLAGLGGGFLGFAFGAIALFNLLGSFQMDHFFKNVEDKTSTRLMASLDTRNRKLVQTYIKVRATEIEGGTANDNLYFRSDKVDTGNPFRDWYATMRSSKFEDEILKKNGVAFTSMVDKDGNIQIAKITRTDNKDLVDTKLKNVNTGNLVETLNNINPEDMEKMFTVDAFDSHKAARASVKDLVNSEIPWRPTFKRRHMRRDIANKTGIKNWRLFEKTRDKLAKNKQDIKDRLLNKIIEKYYVNNPASAQFMKCLFSNGRCSVTSDPADPSNKTESPTVGKTPEELDGNDTNPDTTDAAGNRKPGDTLATGSAGDEIKDTIDTTVEKAAKGEAVEEAEQQLVKLGPGKQIILALVRTLSGDVISSGIPVNPTKIWTWAKRIAKVDGLLAGAAGASKLATMVENARSAQLEGVFATYSIANDQIKSGELSKEELAPFFDTTKNLGNSEGWATLTGQMNNGTVSAATPTPSNISKASYCNPDHKKTFDEFAWMCDSQKPNNGGNAEAISKGYNDTAGKIAGPIASTVNAVNDSPIGTVADWVNDIFDKVLGSVLDPVVSTIMENTGLGQGISTLMSTAMTYVLGFLGAAPTYDPGNDPGVANLIIAGAASTFEGSTRASGGVRATPTTTAFSNSLASQYTKTQESKQSLMERYASLDNPDSLASASLFALSSNTSLSTVSSRFSSYLGSLPATIGSLFTRNVFAQQQQPATSLADWAGVKRYDIPGECINLDPIDPGYLEKSTNVGDIGLNAKTLGYETLRDTDKFYQAVYEKLKDDPEAEAKAGNIYNCALLDARSMGNLGAVFGYTNDNAYGETTAAAASTTPTTGGGSANCQSTTGNDKIACEGDKYVGLPYSHQGVHADGGAENYRKRCPDSKIPGDASCAIDCSAFVSVMLYDAYGTVPDFPKNISLYVSTTDGSLINQTAGSGPTPLFREISLTEIKPGDVLSMPNHMGVVESWDPATGKLKSIESVGGGNRLGPNHWQWNSVSEEGYNRAWRYVGPGAAS